MLQYLASIYDNVCFSTHESKKQFQDSYLATREKLNPCQFENEIYPKRILELMLVGCNVLMTSLSDKLPMYCVLDREYDAYNEFKYYSEKSTDRKELQWLSKQLFDYYCRFKVRRFDINEYVENYFNDPARNHYRRLAINNYLKAHPLETIGDSCFEIAFKVPQSNLPDKEVRELYKRFYNRLILVRLL